MRVYDVCKIGKKKGEKNSNFEDHIWIPTRSIVGINDPLTTFVKRPGVEPVEEMYTPDT